MANENPPAGWYTDPEDASKSRYWDGENWAAENALRPPDPKTLVTDSVEKVKKPIYKRKSVIAVAVIVLLAIAGSGGENATPASSQETVAPLPAASPSPTISETPEEVQTPEVIESPSEEPTPVESLSPLPDSPVYFYTSASGDLAEMNKDLGDLLDAIATGGTIRMATNALEVSFNIGQLQSLTPPDAIAEDWNREFAKLQKTTDAVTEGISADSSVSQLKKQVKTAQAQVKVITKIVNRLS